MTVSTISRDPIDDNASKCNRARRADVSVRFDTLTAHDGSHATRAANDRRFCSFCLFRCAYSRAQTFYEVISNQNSRRNITCVINENILHGRNKIRERDKQHARRANTQNYWQYSPVRGQKIWVNSEKYRNSLPKFISTSKKVGYESKSLST